MACEWTTVLLRDLIEFTRDGEWGGDQPTADTVEMRVVRGTDFARLRLGALEEIPRRYIERGAAERKQLRPGDVLIETAGGTKDQSTGRTALVKQSHIDRAGFPLTCASFARFLRFDRTKIDSGFMYWWLQGLHASGEMEMHQVQHTGVARFQFTKFVESTEAPVPPLPEQRAIAHVLGTLDEKIELNRRMNETLEAMARAIFKSWFIDFDPVRAKAEGRDPGLPKPIADLFPDRFEDAELGDIPAGWKVETLGNVIELAYGNALKQEVRKAGSVAVFGSNGQVGWHDEKLVTGPGIVVGRKGNPGVVKWVPTDFFPIDTTFYVVPKNKCHSLHFLFYALKVQDLASLGADSAVPGLNRNLAYMSKQIVPPGALLDTFESFVTPLFQRIYEADNESGTLAGVRDALLPRLISGELRVKDAERLLGVQP